MNNLSLYDITSGFPALMENTEMSDEEKQKIQEELLTLLKQKSQNIIGYIRNIELTVEAMKMEENRLSEQRKALETRLEKFKIYVKDCMEQNGFANEKIVTPLGTLSIRKNPISIEIESEDAIPEEYKNVIVTKKVDKTKIKNDFKETGEIPDGVQVITNKTSLVIK